MVEVGPTLVRFALLPVFFEVAHGQSVPLLDPNSKTAILNHNETGGAMAKLNVLESNATIGRLEDAIRVERQKMSANVFYKEILAISGAFFLEDPAMELAKLVKDRDWPMTREEIVEVFETSGLTFLASHIDASKPDSKKETEQHRQEFLADYHSIYS